ncbi:MAG: hypothetical protein ACYDAP_05960 [Thermoplasmataceae archaeon]
MSKHKIKQSRANTQLELLVRMIRKDGHSYGPEMVNYGKDEIGTTDATVYSSMNLLESAGIIKRESLNGDDMSRYNPGTKKWSVIGSTIFELSRVFMFILRQTGDQIAIGKIISSEWYYRNITRIIDEHNKELQEIVGKLAKINPSDFQTYVKDHVIGVSKSVRKAGLPIMQPDRRNEFLSLIEGKVCKFIIIELSRDPIFASLFFTIVYLLRDTSGVYPNGLEIGTNDRAFLPFMSAWINLRLKEYPKKDPFIEGLKGLLSCLFSVSGNLRGEGYAYLKDPEIMNWAFSVLKHI